MRRCTIALAASLLPAGCGSDDSGDTPASAAAPAAASAPPPASTAATAPRRTGTLIKLAGSDYGRILYASPPVYTRGEPRAGRGVNVRLLGTIARNGRRQVTYAGRPLYFYAHEGRNEVRCQNVYEFRGTWLVVKASGRPVR